MSQCPVGNLFLPLKGESIKEDPLCALEKVSLIAVIPKAREPLAETVALLEAVERTRDLVNGNSEEVTPQKLAEVAQEIARNHPKVKTTIFDKRRIEKEKMGLLLAVNQGSARDPVFMITRYQGAPGSKEHTVLVGKGITYDTGGLNLKPGDSMETMRDDMAGAAVVLNTIAALAAAKIPVNCTAVVASTENCIDAKAYRPGDVFSGYAGKTVEIGNTDAEGRLVLADALAYACKNLEPTRLIDVATLTGGIVIALGEEMAGLWSNNDHLADQLIVSSNQTYERLWRMPLVEEYKRKLKSDIADLRNIAGRPGTSIKAALFLQEFVDSKIPWAHLDIAAVAFLSERSRYIGKQATGFGVRLLYHFLASGKVK